MSLSFFHTWMNCSPFFRPVANCFDHSRDLLALINTFEDRIKPPIIGVAHSLGCVQLYVSCRCLATYETH
jgi:hypothetical protein